jgi:very-short-patch-repair endonuclease
MSGSAEKSYTPSLQNPSVCSLAMRCNPRMQPYRPALKPRARALRSAPTDAERVLWHRLRRKQLHGVQFYRQKPLGDHIVDFHAPAVGLVVEVDGGGHFDAAGLRRDASRTRALAALGLTVLRYDNLQVLQHTDAVLDAIWDWMALRLRAK